MFAPASTDRAKILPKTRAIAASERGEAAATGRQQAMSWAQRLKQAFAIDIETCRQCGGHLRVVGQHRRSLGHAPGTATLRCGACWQGTAGSGVGAHQICRCVPCSAQGQTLKTGTAGVAAGCAAAFTVLESPTAGRRVQGEGTIGLRGTQEPVRADHPHRRGIILVDVGHRDEVYSAVAVRCATNPLTSWAPIRQLLVAFDPRPPVQHGVEHRIRRRAPATQRGQRQAGFLEEALPSGLPWCAM